MHLVIISFFWLLNAQGYMLYLKINVSVYKKNLS